MVLGSCLISVLTVAAAVAGTDVIGVLALGDTVGGLLLMAGVLSPAVAAFAGTFGVAAAGVAFDQSDQI